MKKIVTIIGARPQFIKAATVSRASKNQLHEVIVHTGQHYDENMSEIFFTEMDIPKPQYQLQTGGQGHGAMTGRILEKVEEILMLEKPDWVLVYGDTNSTLGGALAAAKLHIPIAHVEAGLRSFNRKMPEEINRVLTDHCSTVLFTPTETATKQLEREGFDPKMVVQVGDVMFDAARFYQAHAKDTILKKLKLNSKEYVLATLHRAENTDDSERLKNLIDGIIDIAETVPVVFPLHPRTRQALELNGLMGKARQKLNFIEPVGYLDMITLESNAETILTDSGGVQKEAFFFQVPCITLRSETEWVELVDAGYNLLSPLTPQGVTDSYKQLKTMTFDWKKQLYGIGDASQKIVNILTKNS